MKRILIFGLIIATLSSSVIGFFLNYFYAFEFDETVKILPIWKVVCIYFFLALSFSLLAYFVESKWNNSGLFVINAAPRVGSLN
jgi:riboflavin transporter FmnP